MEPWDHVHSFTLDEEAPASLESFCSEVRSYFLDLLAPFQGNTIAHLGVHAGPNAGDCAIAYAESILARDSNLHVSERRISGTGSWLTDLNATTLQLVMLQWGGNIGDTYSWELNNRTEVLRSLRTIPTLQMPQSVHFDEPSRADEFKEAVARHSDFMFLARDRKTYEWATENLQCRVLLVTDVALSLGPAIRPPSKPRHDIFALVRTGEIAPTRGDPGDVARGDWTPEPRLRHDLRMLPRFLSERFAGTPGLARRFAIRTAKARTQRGFQVVANGRILLTDRLHGVILAALAGVPVVAVDNSYGKVHGFIKTWSLDERADVTMAANFSDARQVAERRLHLLDEIGG